MPEVLPDHLKAALYQFFHRLRNDLQTQLGVGEYKLLFEAQEKGIPLHDEAALRRLCQAIWLKDQTRQASFAELFQAIVVPAFRETATATQVEDKAIQSPVNKPKVDPDPQPPPEHLAQTDEPSDEEALARIPDATVMPGEGTLSIAMEQGGGFVLEQAEEAPVREAGISTHRFLLNERYLPVSPRDMQQHWRFLQNNFDRGVTPEIDLLKTVASIARRGILLEPVFHKKTVNRTHLLFLIDDSASMTAFETLAQRLVEAALEDPFVTDEEVFYFSNYPSEYLYLNTGHTASETCASVWRRCHRHTLMLIVSDGGAARGQADFNRIRATNAFLKTARRHVQRMAWLNPMPRERWENTSAEYIGRNVPMFEIERIGLYKAIQTLKGKLF